MKPQYCKWGLIFCTRSHIVCTNISTKLRTAPHNKLFYHSIWIAWPVKASLDSTVACAQRLTHSARSGIELLPMRSQYKVQSASCGKMLLSNRVLPLAAGAPH